MCRLKNLFTSKGVKMKNSQEDQFEGCECRKEGKAPLDLWASVCMVWKAATLACQILHTGNMNYHRNRVW
jgi:hypothetical protein